MDINDGINEPVEFHAEVDLPAVISVQLNNVIVPMAALEEGNNPEQVEINGKT